MDEYVVGSVADIISNKVQSKKKKSKLNVQSLNQVTIRDGENIHSANTLPNINSESEKSSSSYRISAKNFLPDKKRFSKVPKNMNHRMKNNTPSKEYTLSGAFIPFNTDFKRKSFIKENEEILPLDHIPSDSEGENEGRESRPNKKRSKVLTKEISPKENQENTVFVGNIPITYDKQKVCKVFSKFGEIQNARIRCVPVENINMSKKVAAIKKKFNPKRNSLVAFVKYKSQDSANAALKANGMVIDGHHIRVDLAGQIKERENNKAVFVGGLPFDIEDDELWEFFQNCGEINSVRVIRDSQTSMGKGFGYVNFVSTASVELALQLDGQQLKKRTINVKRCVKCRNKNKLNSFGRKKSKEITNELLCKKNRKLTEGKKKTKNKNNDFPGGFQGKIASVKQKKKKKLSKPALRQRKIVKILGAK